MKLNRFIVNSDYTAEKQSNSFTITLNNTTFSVAAGQIGTRSVDYTVPSGIYFENVTWQSTNQTGSIKYAGNFLGFVPTDQMSDISYTIAQVDNATYRLTATVANWDTSSHSYTVGASAKVHLSISPF